MVGACHALVIDYPFGEIVGQNYAKEVEFYRYSKDGIKEVDLRGGDAELSDIYLKYIHY